MNTYPNTEFVTLSDYIPADYFRTVYMEQLEIPHGKTEILVQIEFAKKSPDSSLTNLVLPDCYAGMMFVYGFARENEALKFVFTGTMAQDYPNRKISLCDWQDKFLLLFENGSKTAEKAFFVQPHEVAELMETCRHPNGE